MAFSYAPLPGPNTIRLLSLEPGLGHTPIQARLTDHRLDECLSYDALSYVWGEPNLTQTLMVNERVVHISKHLYAILLQLRYADSTRMLWIDAVCINQQDGMEKGQQVALMGQIYQQAHLVLCWLGPLTTHALWALKFLKGLAEDARRYFKPDLKQYYWTIPLNDDVLLPRVNAGQAAEAALEAHVDLIYANDWFTRLWIVQELALATDPRILCGSFELSWDDFEMATRILVRCLVAVSKPSKPFMSIIAAWDLAILRGRYKLDARSAIAEPVIVHADQQWSIGRLAWDMRDKKCQDEKDKVYALLSRTTSGITHKILAPDTFIPDYTKPVAWAYYQFWKRFGGSTSLFYAGLSRRGGGKTKKHAPEENVSDLFCDTYLPSWVPDLHSHSDEWSPVFGLDYGTSTPFQHLTRYFNNGPSILMIRGHRLDGVARVFPRHETEHYIQLRAKIKRYVSLEHEYAPYPTGQTWIEALGSTLVMDEPYDHEHPFQTYVNTIKPRIRVSDHEIQRIWSLYRELFLADTGKLWNRIFSAILSQARTEFDINDEFDHDERLVWLLHRFLGKVLQTHCFFVTKAGYMGLGPPDTLVGDVVAALGGPSVPFVIRDTSAEVSGDLEANGAGARGVTSDIGTPMSRLMGPCYLQGVMKAELLNEGRWKKDLDWEGKFPMMVPKPTLYLI